jgi:hypothetical protein
MAYSTWRSDPREGEASPPSVSKGDSLAQASPQLASSKKEKRRAKKRHTQTVSEDASHDLRSDLKILDEDSEPLAWRVDTDSSQEVFLESNFSLPKVCTGSSEFRLCICKEPTSGESKGAGVMRCVSISSSNDTEDQDDCEEFCGQQFYLC